MQQILTEEGYQRLEIEASRYNDICTILKKLKENGFFKALYDLIFCVFASEHDFTVKMLTQMQKQKKGEGFKFNELYRINSGIFCSNFQLINKIIIDDIFMQFTSKVCSQIDEFEDQKHQNQGENSFNSKLSPHNLQQPINQVGQAHQISGVISQNVPNQEGISQQLQQASSNMEINNLNQNLNYIMQFHPEIDVAIQQMQKKTTPRTSSHHSTSKPQIQLQDGTQATFNPQSTKSLNKSHSHSVQEIQIYNKNEPSNQYQNEQLMNQSVNGIKNNLTASQQQLQNQSITALQQQQPRFYQQNLLQNAAKYSHSPPNRSPALHNTNSQIRVNSLQNSVQLNPSINNQQSGQFYVQQFNSTASQQNAMMNNSNYSSSGRQNQMNSYIQTSQGGDTIVSNFMNNNKVYLPYSEFSYTKGGTFSKSQRKLHDIQNNPGVGQYESGHKKSSSSVPFNKQEKKTIFEKKSDYQSTLYYPSHHFVAKSPQTSSVSIKQ
ncbi:hypothetical protein ABPG72_008818 [Tetrahymena utriculariae]